MQNKSFLSLLPGPDYWILLIKIIVLLKIIKESKFKHSTVGKHKHFLNNTKITYNHATQRQLLWTFEVAIHDSSEFQDWQDKC